MAAIGVGTKNPFDLLMEDGERQSKKTAPKKEETPKPRASRPAKDSSKERADTGNRSSRRNNKRQGRREFDRRSGTGRGKEVSKGGHGRGGWGGEKEFDSDEPKRFNRSRKPRQEKSEEAGESTEQVDGAEEPAEPEQVTLSLAEYRKQLESKKVAADSHSEARAAVVDDNKWEAVTEMSREVAPDEEFDFVAKAQAAFAAKKKGKNKKKKSAAMSLDEFAKTNKGGRGRGQRGDRGRGRQGPRGGSDRRGNRNGSTVKLSDTSAFPTLGGK